MQATFMGGFSEVTFARAITHLHSCDSAQTDNPHLLVESVVSVDGTREEEREVKDVGKVFLWRKRLWLARRFPFLHLRRLLSLKAAHIHCSPQVKTTKPRSLNESGLNSCDPTYVLGHFLFLVVSRF